MSLGTQSYDATTVPSKVLFSPEANSQFSGVIYMHSEGIQS